MHTPALVPRLTDGAGVVRGEERADNELARLDVPDRAADLRDDAAVLVPHRPRLIDRLNAAVGPQVGSAHAGGRKPDDSIRRLDDRRFGALLEAHVAGGVDDCSSHSLSPLSFLV